MKKFLLSIFCCLMAVFAVQAQSYVKVTSAPADWSGEYLIVYEAGNVAFNGGLTTLDAVSNTIPVTIADNAIEATDVVNAAKFTINASGNILSASGYYIGQTSNANGLKSSTSTTYANTLSLNADGSVNVVSASAYLRYNAAKDQLRFRYYKSSSYTGQRAIALYKYTEGVGGEEVITLENPIISPEKTTFNDGESIEVAITAEEGATIHYTLDGNDPTEESDVYSAPISITETTTVKAIAVKEGCKNSEVAEATYTAIDPDAAAFEIIAEKQGYANGDVVETLTFGDVTATLAKGSNSNNVPKYYDTGKGIRAYGGNTITFTGVEGVAINKIELEFGSGDGSNTITADCGTYSDGVWNGNSNKVVLTVGGTSGHRRIASIKVTYSMMVFHLLSVTDAGYATLYLDYAVQIPTDVETYIVTGINDGWVTLTQIEGVLPAETGVIIKADAGDYEFKSTTETPADVTGNMLKGSTEDASVTEEAYVLGNVGEVGLYKAEMNQEGGTAWLNNANKAYLPASSVPNKTIEFYGFDWGGTTGIENIEGVAGNNRGEGAIYDLTGRKINSIAVTGIYIIDGKKVFIRK